MSYQRPPQGSPPYGANEIVSYPTADYVLVRGVTAIAVFLGLFFVAYVLFDALWLGRFWNIPGHTPTCTSVADQSTVPLALLIVNATATDCPLNEGECSTPTAIVVSSGNVTLQSSPATVVGYHTQTCTTIGSQEEDSTIRACDFIVLLNGEGGLDAGMLTFSGLKTVADADPEDVTFPAPFAITGGASNYARPIGGELTLGYNGTTTELTLTGTATYVN